eukprot:TRINITY_DN22416_c0_g1_i1.p1 TRINITY_DN22416_c0_g1~~TRINITY_DN22416_c0_g1_i1.p1  ORF type:complete len:1337 (-),score=184.37 TRINITY_DN22416_c0_g1_i1:70-4080(-)
MVSSVHSNSTTRSKRPSGEFISVASSGSYKHDTFQKPVNVDELRLPNAHWESSKKRDAGCLERVSQSVALEASVTVCVMLDLFMTIAVLAMDPAVGESLAVFVVSAFLLAVMAFDVLVRIMHDGVVVFFKRPLNVFEFLVTFLGMGLQVFDGVARTKSASTSPASNARTTTSLGRTIRPVLRGVRIVRALFQATTGRAGISAQFFRQTDRLKVLMVQQVVRDILLVAQENVAVSTRGGGGSVHIEKATIRTSRFSGLHLPFVIDSGILSLLHVDINLFDFRFGSRANARKTGCLVVIEDAILILRPGHHQEPPKKKWDFQAVQSTKGKLVTLLTKRMEATAKPSNANEGGAANQSSNPARRFFKGKNPITYMKRRLKNVAQKILAKGMHVELSNVEIRFEDPKAELSRDGHAVVSGVQISSVRVGFKGMNSNSSKITRAEFRTSGRWRCGDNSIVQRETTESHDEESASLQKPLNKLPIQIAADAIGVAAFWNMYRPSKDKTSIPGYSALLQEGSSVDMSAFLADRSKARKRESFRLALCDELQARLAERFGAHVARERTRRIRLLVLMHQYILRPCCVSLHTTVSRPTEEKADDRDTTSTDSTESPTVDADVYVQEVNFAMCLDQAASIFAILDYLKRWIAEDSKFKWKPPRLNVCADLPLARLRWAYALERVLHRIDPFHQWSSLFWLELRKRKIWQREYFAALCGVPPLDHQLITMFQVGLPLPQILLCRRDAAVFRATRQREKSTWWRRLLRTTMMPAWKMLPLGTESTDTESSSVGSQALDDDVVVSVDQSKESVGASASQPFSAQIRFQVNCVAASLLQAVPGENTNRKSSLVLDNKCRRRPVINILAENITVHADKSAPWEAWARLAPPNAVLDLVRKSPLTRCNPDVVVEATTAKLTAVLCVAPSSAPQLRRLGACGSGLWDSCKFQRPSGFTPRRTQTDMAIRFRAMFNSRNVRHGLPELNTPTLEFAMCVMPIQAVLCKPLITELTMALKRSVQNGFQEMGSLISRRPTETSAEESDNVEFRRRIQDICKRHDMRIALVRRNIHACEKVLGLTGPLQNARISGIVHLLGGLRAEFLQPYTTTSWLLSSVQLPQGKLDVMRSANPCKGFSLGFQPSGDSRSDVVNGGHCCFFQGIDGWWYDSPVDMACIEEVTNTGILRSVPAVNDETCVGADARELLDEEQLNGLPRDKRYTPNNSAPGIASLKNGSFERVPNPLSGASNQARIISGQGFCDNSAKWPWMWTACNQVKERQDAVERASDTLDESSQAISDIRIRTEPSVTLPPAKAQGSAARVSHFSDLRINISTLSAEKAGVALPSGAVSIFLAR